jgi:hypothetical protein
MPLPSHWSSDTVPIELHLTEDCSSQTRANNKCGLPKATREAATRDYISPTANVSRQ